jgi:hypothetical protein
MKTQHTSACVGDPACEDFIEKDEPKNKLP